MVMKASGSYYMNITPFSGQAEKVLIVEFFVRLYGNHIGSMRDVWCTTMSGHHSSFMIKPNLTSGIGSEPVYLTRYGRC